MMLLEDKRRPLYLCLATTKIHSMLSRDDGMLMGHSVIIVPGMHNELLDSVSGRERRTGQEPQATEWWKLKAFPPIEHVRLSACLSGPLLFLNGSFSRLGRRRLTRNYCIHAYYISQEDVMLCW